MKKGNTVTSCGWGKHELEKKKKKKKKLYDERVI